MEQNKDFVLIYDADCPMCRWYTGEFVKHQLLSKNGREAYHQIGAYTQTKVDMQKAKNHIALLNKKTGQVTYGFDSLVAIVGARWQWIKTISTNKIIAPFFAAVYDFISYNRKVIAPSASRGYLDCIPEKNLVMRTIFIIICMLFVEITGGIYFSTWFSEKTYYSDLAMRESLLFVSQILFQGIMTFVFREKRVYDYLGHVAVVSAFGGLLLIPLHAGLLYIQYLGLQIDFLSAAGLGAVIMAMFIEHKRRVNLMGYHKALSYTWVLFRIILFFVIFKVG